MARVSQRSAQRGTLALATSLKPHLQGRAGQEEGGCARVFLRATSFRRRSTGQSGDPLSCSRRRAGQRPVEAKERAPFRIGFSLSCVCTDLSELHGLFVNLLGQAMMFRVLALLAFRFGRVF